MRTINTYIIFDLVSEIVVTTFVAVNDVVAKRSFEAWKKKSEIEDGDVKLYNIGSCSCPDNANDLQSLIDNEEATTWEV